MAKWMTNQRSMFVRGGAAAFSPLSLSGLALWLDATAITGLSDGAAVASWADSSGNGRNVTQGTSGARPTYKTGAINNRAAVLFDGGDYLAHNTASAWTFLHNGSNAAVFAVASASDVTIAHGIVATSSNSNTIEVGYGLSTTTNARCSAYIQSGKVGGSTSTATGNNAIAQSTPFAIANLIDADATPVSERLALYINGGTAVKTNDLTIPPSANAPTNALHVGSRAVFGGNPVATFTGHIAEIIIYNALLSAADANRVGAYLAAKWGLTWTNIS